MRYYFTKENREGGRERAMEGVRFDVLDEEEKKRYIKGDRGDDGERKGLIESQSCPIPRARQPHCW